MSNIHPSESSYAIDQESSVEMARLIDLDAQVTRQMRGLFPADVALANVHDVLDIACGPGGWAMNVAFTYPQMQVTGIDISQTMQRYAQAQARVQGLRNVSFLTMDATAPLAFPDASFDFVNARFIMGFMWKEAWPTLLRECVRITRPGGTVCITDTDTASVGVTNSQALSILNRHLVRAAYRSGRSFCSDEDCGLLGITPMLRGFFELAGCTTVRQQAHMLDYSYGAESHVSNCRNLRAAVKLLQPFLMKLKMVSAAEFETLYEQMLLEMSQNDFRGIWYFMSAWGNVPA